MSLTVGDVAPDFTLMDEACQHVRLSDLRGKKVVLLFYPMDFSPVCTREHCAFGPAMWRLCGEDANTLVFGVNCDTPFTHAAYKAAYDIPYPLLSDPTRHMVQAYGMYSGLEPFNCAKRGTVIVGPDGRVTHHEVIPHDVERSLDALVAAASA